MAEKAATKVVRKKKKTRRRRDPLARLSLGELRLALKKREKAEARKLNKRREKALKELEEIDAELKQFDDSAVQSTPRAARRAPAAKKKVSSRPARRKTGGKKGPRKPGESLEDHVRKAMPKGKKMNLQAIVQGVLDAGYRTKSDKLRVMVGQRLAAMGNVKRVSRGIYARLK